MKASIASCVMFFRQIYSDSMLIMIQVAPLLAGLAFKFVIPAAASYFGFTAVIAPYYPLFDCMYAMLMPYMMCFASAMVILSEIDDSIASYFYITPVGRSGYIISRLIFPAVIGFVFDLVLVPIFALSQLSTPAVIVISLLASMNAVIAALFTISAAENRVEGMALAKLSTVILLGSFVPFFMHGPVSYIFMILPSYWISAYIIEETFHSVLFGTLSAAVWCITLYKTGSIEAKGIG